MINPNSICVAENEVLRARLRRNKELATEIRHIMRAPGMLGEDDTKMILNKLNEIIIGK